MDSFEQQVSLPFSWIVIFSICNFDAECIDFYIFGMMNGLYQCKVSFDLNPAVYIIVVNNNENILCFCSVMRR